MLNPIKLHLYDNVSGMLHFDEICCNICSCTRSGEPLMFITALVFTLGSAAVASNPAYPVVMPGVEASSELAVAPLMSRRNDEAISLLEQARLENPSDPAILINLGIAHAQIGQDDEARALFAEVLQMRAAMDLATSGGRVADSRQLARRAIRMLDHGEFRLKPTTANQLTLRD
jgi:tetratricopeptide (TPR) repeat protein